MPESSDPYTYPGTEVLRNLLNIQDSDQLAAFEANATAARLIELDAMPVTGQFDSLHLKAIHGHLFQDVYAWAGEFRTVNISKSGHLFASAAFVEPALEQALRPLAADPGLKATDVKKFADHAGYLMSEINAVHPFRDGNGRAQREFIREPALQSGVLIDWSRIAREQMLDASLQSFKTGDSSAMATAIKLCIVPKHAYWS